MSVIDLKIIPGMAKVTLQSVPDQPGIAAEVFSTLGEKGINVDLLSTIATGKGRGDISFAVSEQEIEKVRPLLEVLKKSLSAKKTEIDTGVSLVSLYGEKLSSDPAFSSRLFKSLAKAGINLQMISQSFNALSFLVDRAKAEQTAAILRETGEIEG